MFSTGWVFALTAAVLGSLVGILVLWPRWRQLRREQRLHNARQAFHLRREWLEARFLSLASQSGRPRGLRWLDCEFEDAASFARDRQTGRLRALVGVSIQFEAVPGGGMEDVEAVHQEKAATVVFRLDGPQWETDGRAFFNLNPAETIAHYEHELETVD
jgi:hypothetical protein